MNLGPAEVIVVLVMLSLFLAGVVLPIYAVVDALRASDAQWQSTGQSRGMWVAAILAGLFIGVVPGVVLAVVYLFTTRPKLAAGG